MTGDPPTGPVHVASVIWSCSISQLKAPYGDLKLPSLTARIGICDGVAIAAVRVCWWGILTFMRKSCSHGGRVLMCSFHDRGGGGGLMVWGSGMLIESWLWLRRTATGVHVGKGSYLFRERRRGRSMYCG